MSSNFRYLRILKLPSHEISDSIEQLIHLRLLDIYQTRIKELPKSITKLYNLQTLRIEIWGYVKQFSLPEDLSNLIKLRHIHINRTVFYHKTPKNMRRLTCLQTLPIFIVGPNEGYHIKELGPLKNLRGKIRIENLENVKDEKEAKSAKLNEKEIFNLQLYWHWNRAEEDRYDKDEEVLEGLQPHPNLKTLLIGYYSGKKFPSWVGSSLYHNLIQINLRDCKECDEVPTLGQLPSLTVLTINQMHKVRSIGSELYFYRNGSYRNTTTKLFPALRILELWEMSALEEWKDAKELTSTGEVFPCLETLTLFECGKLRYLPGVLSLIQHLEIEGCGIDELPSGHQYCKSLQYFKIENCPNLKSIPESLPTCSSLQNFIVIDCPKLRSLPGVPSVIQQLVIIECGINELPRGLQSCKSLQYFKIEGCPDLKSIPDLGEAFHSLINLKLSNCRDLRLKLSRREGRLKTSVIGGYIEELDAFSILRYPFIRYSHTSLKRLRLHGSPTLKSLPNEIQFFTALEELRIQNFNGMEALPDWFTNLSSLQKLSLDYCKKLMYLPILHLTNLKHLHIDYCRNLESSAEWLQMPHIRNVKINEIYIEGNNSEDSEDFDDFDDYDDSEYEVSDDSEDNRDDSLQEDFSSERDQVDDN